LVIAQCVGEPLGWTSGSRSARIRVVKREPERDPLLRMIDAVLDDLSVRAGMYVGRRRQDGNAESFVIQTGEEGRYRVRLPDPSSDASIHDAVTAAQAHLVDELGAPVPLCPRHHHALAPAVAQGGVTWTCPDGKWQCALGEYEELTWPQLDVESLAPILMRRLHRRSIAGIVTVGVSRGARGAVAEIGVIEKTPALMKALRDAATPLRLAVHVEKARMIRVGALPR
jgi:hypothetical protein